MRRLQKIVTNVGKEMFVTGQNRNVNARFENKFVNSQCLDHPISRIAAQGGPNR